MIANKKEFYGGVGMMAAFVVVLIIIFSPVFKGKNGLEFLDELYNTISKGSAYYIPKVNEETDKFIGNSVTVTFKMANETQADQTAPLFEQGGASVSTSGAELKVTGDLGTILENCLADAEAMYRNNGQAVSGKYGYDEKRALFNWWQVCKAMEKDLKKQKKFKEAKVVALVGKRLWKHRTTITRLNLKRSGHALGLLPFP